MCSLEYVTISIRSADVGHRNWWHTLTVSSFDFCYYRDLLCLLFELTESSVYFQAHLRFSGIPLVFRYHITVYMVRTGATISICTISKWLPRCYICIPSFFCTAHFHESWLKYVVKCHIFIILLFLSTSRGAWCRQQQVPCMSVSCFGVGMRPSNREFSNAWSYRHMHENLACIGNRTLAIRVSRWALCHRSTGTPKISSGIWYL